jgi:hypothetical protein
MEWLANAAVESGAESLLPLNRFNLVVVEYRMKLVLTDSIETVFLGIDAWS